MVIARQSGLELYSETGDIVDAELNPRLLENIFFKNSPLHDGAVIIINNRIHGSIFSWSKSNTCSLKIV